MIVTTLTACIFGFLYVALAINIIKLRRSLQVSVGYGDSEELHRAIRAHSNLTEYAPLMLILLATLEFNQAPILLTGLLALAVIGGRLLHARAMTQPASKHMPLRILGMQLTLFPIIALCAVNLLWLIWHFILS